MDSHARPQCDYQYIFRAQSKVLEDTQAGQARAKKRALFLLRDLNIGARAGRGIIQAALACNPAARVEGRGRVQGRSPSWYLDWQEDSGTSPLSGDSRRPLGPASCNISGLLVCLKSPLCPGGLSVPTEPSQDRETVHCREAGSHHVEPLG